MLYRLQFTKYLIYISQFGIHDKVNFLTRLSHTSGMPRFFGSFVFNRKRNVVELELKEDLTGRGSMKYSVSTPRISKIMIREPMY